CRVTRCRIWPATSDSAGSRPKWSDQERKMLKATSRKQLQGAASLEDRVAIVRRKRYRGRVHFLRFIPGLSSSWPSLASKRSRLNQMKPGQTVKPKVESASAELRVWCESCCIRIAPNEERTIVRGKTYHSHCYSKLSTKPKN